MDDDQHLPRIRHGAAQQLGSEDLAPLSMDELDERIALLKTEIERVERHRNSAQKHRVSAEALFRK